VTDEDAANLTAGTPAWVAGFSLEGRTPAWEVYPVTFDHLFHSPWLEETAAMVYERGMTAEDGFTAKLDELHGDRLEAFRWVAARFADFRRTVDDAAQRLAMEIAVAQEEVTT
jgi:hypothetical protein